MITESLAQAAALIHPQTQLVAQHLPHCSTYRIVLWRRPLFSVHHADAWPVTVEHHHADRNTSTTWAGCEDGHDPNKVRTTAHQPIDNEERLVTLLVRLTALPETQALVRLMEQEGEAARKAAEQAQQQTVATSH